MKLSFTFSLYVCRKFLIGIAIICTVISTIIISSSFLEVIRITHSKNVSFSILAQLVLLKYPYLLQKIFPFCVLLGAIYSFFQLTKTSELIIARSVGISAWEFLLPVTISAFIMGILIITFLNPLSAALLNKQEKIAHKYLQGGASTLTVSPSASGLWLREHTKESNLFINAKSVYSKKMILYDAVLLLLDDENNFIKRINAKTVTLEKGYWFLKEAVIFSPSQLSENVSEYRIKTNFVMTKLQDSFGAPETISFWQLPTFIRTLKNSGFSALKHLLHFYQLLAMPLFLCSMVFIAASFSLRPHRQGKTGLLIICGIITGFSIYFFADLISALGLSGAIPISIAALAPIIISLLFGIALILHLEDG